MKSMFFDQKPGKAALAVGISFITSVLIVTLIDDLLLPNFVIPGDPEVLARDIEADKQIFYFAVIGYLLVLVLDSIIGIALYIVLKSTNKTFALLTGVLRLLYALTLTIGLIAVAFQLIDIFSYSSIKLFGYIFFALHIAVLGYSVFKSGFIPKSLGLLLMIASPTYIVFFVDIHLPEPIMVGIMSIMAISELALSIWLIIKRNSLPENSP